MAQCLIGTSGWVYQHWREVFYPADLRQTDWLSFYAEHFCTVEINNSFYRLPTRATFQRWHKQTPPKFVFAIKGNRFITHMRKLRNVEEPLQRFWDAVEGLGSKARVILWQLPPMLKADAIRLRDFVEQLPRSYHHVFEFRHHSWWMDKATLRVLEDCGCAFCIPSAPHLPKAVIVTTNFSYIRMHGWDELYAGCYPLDELKWWAREIRKLLRRGMNVYVYFNNDAHGYAVRNAMELMKLLK
ncbi:MAG TPA: DUF72 domain-containing protein [Armatimonadetes bacterium]|nr:DUF72 domain-containing protein [Armatimonadota bacterium]